MNIELTTDITPDDLIILKDLYINSFPAEERRDWDLIVSPSTEGHPRLYLILADGKIAGLLTLWIFDRFAYIEHLAVDPALHGGGIGSSAIRLIAEKLDNKPIVVEIEPPTEKIPQTIRRRDFYSRLGFVTISTDYIQPPYAEGLPSVPLHLLATTALPPASTASTLHREVYKAI